LLSGPRRFLAEHRVLLVVCMVIMVNQLGFGIVVPVTPIYARTFGVNEAAIGLVVAVYGLGRFLFSVPVGQAADRFGRKQVILGGTLLTCVGSLLCGLAGDFTQLLIFRFIAGVGSTAVITGTQIVVADIATRQNRGRMMSTYQGFFQFAVGVGPGVGGLVALFAGYRAPFFVFAALTLVAGLIAVTSLPDTRKRLGETVSGSVIPGGKSAYRLLLGNVGFLTIAVVSLVAAFNRTGAIFSIVPLMGVERLGLNEAAIGAALTVANLCNLAIIGFAGILVDRFGRKLVIVPSCLISGLAFAGFAFANGYPMFVFSAVLWAVGVALSGSASAAYAADQAPPGANGVTMGIYRMLSDAGYVIGPTVLGLIAAASGAQMSLLAAAALAVVATIPFMLLAPETVGRRALSVTKSGT
jgi:MFS transporter, DHA1 family, multidrug resistance protein